MNRRLRTSVLFTMLQEAAIAHTEELGMGREKTLDRGLLWIVTMQRAEVLRMPHYDEDIILRSWPGRTMHLLFPRYFSLETASGEPLLKASSIWSLIDEKTRSLIFPEKYGIEIEGVITGDEISLPSSPRPLKKPAADEQPEGLIIASKYFTVPYSFTDLNGHMNNTRYFDLAEDLITESVPGFSAQAGQTEALSPRLISTEFSKEVRLGESITFRLEGQGCTFYITGTNASCQVCFKMRMEI